METKAVPLEFKAGDEPGSFRGYGAVFGNRDFGGDVIEPNAFKKFQKTKDGQIRIALYHDLDRLVGKASFKQDEKGLHLDGQLNMNVSYAQDAYELMKDGTLDGMSVGFNILKHGSEWVFDEEKKQSTRYIKKAELWEVSVVPFGMNPRAKLTSVKSADDIADIRDFERMLRDSGYSRKQAAAIALHGFKACQRDAGEFVDFQRDADDQSSAMLASLKSQIILHSLDI